MNLKNQELTPQSSVRLDSSEGQWKDCSNQMGLLNSSTTKILYSLCMGMGPSKCTHVHITMINSPVGLFFVCFVFCFFEGKLLLMTKLLLTCKNPTDMTKTMYLDGKREMNGTQNMLTTREPSFLTSMLLWKPISRVTRFSAGHYEAKT